MQVPKVQIPYNTLAEKTIQQTQADKSASSANLLSGEESSSRLSPLLAFSYSHDLTEVSFTSDETMFAYRSEDNSLALKARSKTDINLRQEKITIEATFSAESLGLTAKDFEANGNKPFDFSFSLQQTDINIKYKSVTEEKKTLRKPGEILQDLVKSFTKIMREKGDKNILVNFDDEAIGILMKDERFAKVVQDVLNLINVLNKMKLNDGERKNYGIKLTGKGASYIDHNESLSIDSKQTTIDFKFTILPPSMKENKQIEPANEENQLEENLDITV